MNLPNTFITYIKYNYFAGLKNIAFNKAALHFTGLGIFAFFAFIVGFASGIIKFSFEQEVLSPLVLLILFIFPSFLEESFFRGILIPVGTNQKSRRHMIFYTILSALMFTLWHPLNAFLFNPGAKTLFYNPFFLIIVFALGVICSISYIVTRSLWPAVIIHWFVVIIWTAFLGGRNLVVQNLFS